MIDDPTVYIKLPSIDGERLCKEIVGRSIMIKEIIDVFSEACIDSRISPVEGKDIEVESAMRFKKLIDNVD